MKNLLADPMLLWGPATNVLVKREYDELLNCLFKSHFYRRWPEVICMQFEDFCFKLMLCYFAALSPSSFVVLMIDIQAYRQSVTVGTI